MESVNDGDPLQETAFVYVAKYAVSNRAELLQLVRLEEGRVVEYLSTTCRRGTPGSAFPCVSEESGTRWCVHVFVTLVGRLIFGD